MATKCFILLAEEATIREGPLVAALKIIIVAYDSSISARDNHIYLQLAICSYR